MKKIKNGKTYIEWCPYCEYNPFESVMEEIEKYELTLEEQNENITNLTKRKQKRKTIPSKRNSKRKEHKK